MKFFVAKVNLENFKQAQTQRLRPLMIAYESPKFMLPIRLGMVNGTGEQDLIVYLLSPTGQVEVTNYRTVKIPSNETIPVFVKDQFSDFYTAMFQHSYQQAGKNVVFLEHAWDMAWCDPCAANPLTPEELRQAGVFWLPRSGSTQRPGAVLADGPQDVFITRLHVRYSRAKFPADLKFQSTANRQNFQGRYILQHPFKGAIDCPVKPQYQQIVRDRQEEEAQTLATLTGWPIGDIRRQATLEQGQPERWWDSVWPE